MIYWVVFHDTRASLAVTQLMWHCGSCLPGFTKRKPLARWRKRPWIWHSIGSSSSWKHLACWTVQPLTRCELEKPLWRNVQKHLDLFQSLAVWRFAPGKAPICTHWDDSGRILPTRSETSEAEHSSDWLIQSAHGHRKTLAAILN